MSHPQPSPAARLYETNGTGDGPIRPIARLLEQNQELQQRLDAQLAESRRLGERLTAVESSFAWALACRLARLGQRLAPKGSWRHACLRLMVRGLRLWRREGFWAAVCKAGSRLRGLWQACPSHPSSAHPVFNFARRVCHKVARRTQTSALVGPVEPAPVPAAPPRRTEPLLRRMTDSMEQRPENESRGWFMSSFSRVEALRQKPWYSVELPPEVEMGNGMIHADERRMLYTLARDYFAGVGRIIDGGTYLGTSSLSLGYGLKDRAYRKEPVIDAYDTFIIDENSVKNHFFQEPWMEREVKAGDNVRFVYERNIAAVADYIRVHEGDLLQKPWRGGPIEILFLDVSKSPPLNDFILTNFMPSLLPETGILIQQDQVQEYHVWIAITMEILADCFEVIDYTNYDSMVYRLKHEIPTRMLEKSLSSNVTPAEMEYYYLSFLERFRRMGMGRYTGWRLGMVELGLAVTYGIHIGDLDKARYVLRQVEAKFFDVPDTMNRLAEIRRHLNAGARVLWPRCRPTP